MTPKQAEKYYGGRRAIATKLGISTQAVDKWFRTGTVPIKRQRTLAFISRGKLRLS